MRQREVTDVTPGEVFAAVISAVAFFFLVAFVVGVFG